MQNNFGKMELTFCSIFSVSICKIFATSALFFLDVLCEFILILFRKRGAKAEVFSVQGVVCLTSHATSFIEDV